jgi:hypothetical protein
MAKELKDIGDEYRKASQDSFASVVRSESEIQRGLKASQDSFASVVRSVGEIQRDFQGIALRSVGQALELQTRIAKKAYDAYVSELTKLGQTIFSGYQTFLNRAEEQLPNVGASRSGTQRTAAHRVTSSRRTGAATRQASHKKRGTRKSKRSR